MAAGEASFMAPATGWDLRSMRNPALPRRLFELAKYSRLSREFIGRARRCAARRCRCDHGKRSSLDEQFSQAARDLRPNGPSGRVVDVKVQRPFIDDRGCGQAKCNDLVDIC